ncbi:hypothetical protein JTE90_010552 [Oedothorax gibbosus]|uniref:Gustatory receptor n=1 Tax=Oedothorax gibbosus TaxID=931172 RepID=A0AAV6U3L4_9ARAC|nr:hypothetical protein JTE90_010552 [Oedothorax gibbosus]
MRLKDNSSVSKVMAYQTEVIINSLSKICKLAILIGLPITTNPSDLKFNKRYYAAIKLWLIFINTIKTIALVTSVYFVRLLIESQSVRLTFYASIVFGWAITLAVLCKRKDISTSLNGISKLTSKVGKIKHIGNKHINKAMIFHVISFFLFAAFLCFFFFYQEWSSFKSASEAAMLFDVLPDNLQSACLGLVFSAVIFSFCMGGITCGTVLLLCDSVYIALSDLIECYVDDLRRKFKSKVFSQLSMSEHIGMLKAITYQVKAADRSLSDCTLMLYGMFVCGLYVTVSIALSKDAIFRTKMVTLYIAWNFILVILIFRRLTLSGSRVGLESDKLRNVATECSRRIVSHCDDEKTLLAFNVLLGNIRDAKLVVTGGGMFVIEKSLFLTVVGTMVTYGVILFQGN